MVGFVTKNLPENLRGWYLAGWLWSKGDFAFSVDFNGYCLFISELVPGLATVIKREPFCIFRCKKHCKGALFFFVLYPYGVGAMIGVFGFAVSARSDVGFKKDPFIDKIVTVRIFKRYVFSCSIGFFDCYGSFFVVTRFAVPTIRNFIPPATVADGLPVVFFYRGSSQ